MLPNKDDETNNNANSSSSSSVTKGKESEEPDVKMSNLYNLERPKDILSGVADVSQMRRDSRREKREFNLVFLI
jgi:hypothetical protein